MDEAATFSRRRWWELGWAVLIVALAGWLRLHQLGLAEFKGDEMTATDLARRVLDGHLQTVGLVSSVGASNGPFFVYVVALALSVRDDPLVATGFVAVLATAAVALTYVVMRPRFGALAALGATALFATGPWAVLYGRKIWSLDILPLFTVLLLWSLFDVLERRRTVAAAFVPVLICLAVQLDFAALVLVVPAALVLFYRSRDVHWRALAVGVAAAVLLLGSWLGHEVNNGFADVGKILSRGSGSPGSGTFEAIEQTARILGAANWGYVAGRSRAQFASESGGSWTVGQWAGALAVALLAVGIVTCIVRVVRGGRLARRRPFMELDLDAARRAVLLAWLGGIWLSYATSARSLVFPHYLIAAYPISFAVAALGLSDLASLARPRRRAAATAAAAVALAAIVVSYVAFTVSFRSFLDKHGGADGDYGVVYADSHAIAQAVRARGLRVANDSVIDFLVAGRANAPLTSGTVGVRTDIGNPTPPPCDGDLVVFRALSVCLPPA
jgi:hypothetical protein